jgi:hypothetical protein
MYYIMDSPPEHLIPEQLNFGRKDFAGCKYKYSRIVPLSGSQTVALQIGSTSETLMEIPTNVFNFNESFLYFDLSLAAQPANGGINQYTWYYTDGMPWISEVDLYTRSGIYLCQLPNFQNYMKVVRTIQTPFTEYIDDDQSSLFYPSNSLRNAVPGLTPSEGPAAVNYLEPAYAQVSSAVATQVDLTVNLNLREIRSTIFSLNKDIVFPDIIVLRILWGPANKAMWTSPSNTIPGNNAGTAPGVTALLPVAAALAAPAPVLTAPAVVYNLTLYLATEKNEDLAQSVRSLVNSPQGMNLLVDYPYSYKQNLTGVSQNLSYRFNRGHGKNIMAIISSPFDNSTSETLNVAFDNSNVPLASAAVQTAPGLKVTSYYSQLDNIRLQDINVVCTLATQDDYRENKKFMRNTALLNNIVYQNNWFHQDKFYEDNTVTLCDPTNLDKGLSLVVERKYDLLTNNTAVAATGSNWYTFALVQKYLHIGAQFIQFQ